MSHSRPPRIDLALCKETAAGGGHHSLEIRLWRDVSRLRNVCLGHRAKVNSTQWKIGCAENSDDLRRITALFHSTF